MVGGEKRRDEVVGASSFVESNKKLKIGDDGKNDDDQIISIFVLISGVGYDIVEYVSYLYEFKIDANKYYNADYDYQNINNEEKMEVDQNIRSIEPVLYFRYKDRYPIAMTCVLLGSKLYFMGGSTMYTLGISEDECRLDLYPSSVHVYDLITRQYHPNRFHLKTGKSPSPLTFVADGKIFVLSITEMPPGAIYFESFDPNDDGGAGCCISELESPPYPQYFFSYFDLAGSALINRRFYVSYKSKPYRATFVYPCFIYDLDTCKWTNIDQSTQYRLSLPYSLFIENTLYSPTILPKLDSTIVSYAPLFDDPDTAATQNLNFRDGNLIPIYKEDVVKRCPISLPSYYHSYSKCLVHLGGLLNGTTTASKCFAYIQHYQLEPPAPEQNSTHSLRFLAFEDIQTNIHKDGKTFFRARTLDSSQFSSTGSFDLGTITAAYAFRPSTFQQQQQQQQK